MKTNPMRTGQVGALLSCALLVLAACGGSGGGSSSGGGGGGGTTFPLSGQALKGPFALGATMSVNEQNASLSPTGKVYNVQTTDYLGNFSVPTGVGTNLVEIIGDGFYMDDLTGQLSAAQIQLRAIVDLSVNAKPTVNVLTSLQEQRLKTLMSQGMSYAAAYTQSQAEVLAAFGIDSTKVNSLSTLYSMQYSGTTDADAVLLATSVVLSQMATDAAKTNGTTEPAELSNYINTFASQIANTGAITSSTFIAARNLAETEVNLSAVRSNVDSYYAKYGLSIVAPKFEEWIDKTGAGIVPQRLVPVTSLAFTDVSGADPGQLITSNVVTIAGLGAGVLAPVSVSAGATIIKNNAAVTGVYAEVQDGDTIAMRVTSSGYDETNTAMISVGSSSAPWRVTSIPLGGTISGLTGTGLVLQNNGADYIAIPSGSTSFSFSVAIANGASYSISVLTQPTSPLQICDVLNGSSTVGAAPTSISVVCANTSERMLVANTQDNTVSAYTIDPTSGALIPVAGSPFATGQYFPVSVVVDPSGKFSYVVNCCQSPSSPGLITAFTIDPTTGALSAVPGSPYTAGVVADSITIDPSGRFAYVTNSGDNTISAYAINTTTGALTSIVGSPFAAGSTPIHITADPSGRFVYVANSSGNTISAYSINPGTGALAPIAGSPFAAGSSPTGITVDPSGKFVYVANLADNTVSGYTISTTTGALAPIFGSPFAAGSVPVSVTVDPSGRFAYVASDSPAGTVLAYTIDPTTGALTLIAGNYAAGGSSYFIALDRSGRFAYVADSGDNAISAYSVNAGTGALTPIAGSPFATGTVGTAPRSIAITPIP